MLLSAESASSGEEKETIPYPRDRCEEQSITTMASVTLPCSSNAAFRDSPVVFHDRFRTHKRVVLDMLGAPVDVKRIWWILGMMLGGAGHGGGSGDAELCLFSYGRMSPRKL